MRNIILLLLTFFTVEAFSQKVTIIGTALDTTNGRNRVYISVNDTLRKFREGKSPNWDIYRNLIKDTSLSLFTKADGKFQLKVHKTDSIFFESFRHIPQKYLVSDLLKMKNFNIRLEPQICIPYVACKDTLPSKFYVFVGKKLKVTPEPETYYCDVVIMDSRVKAEYKVLQQVVGDFPKDTIIFTSFNHNQRITFSNYENVLLFVSEYCGKLYHEKYQYFDLYLSTDNKWASPYSSRDYNHPFKDKITVKPERIPFKDEISFPIDKFSSDDIKTWFPKPYYEIRNGRAIAVYGNYVEDLFKLKQLTILKARGIY